MSDPDETRAERWARKVAATQMRTPTVSQSFWGRRLVAGAVLAAVLGAIVAAPRAHTSSSPPW